MKLQLMSNLSKGSLDYVETEVLKLGSALLDLLA